jgi:hypothetical protein
LNNQKEGPKSAVNTKILPISKKAYKELIAQRNAKIIAVSQMMDIHRS